MFHVLVMALSALTATSREMISITTQAETRPREMSMINAEVNKYLIRDGIKKSSEGGLQLEPPGNEPVEEIRERRNQEQSACHGRRQFPWKKQQDHNRGNEDYSSHRQEIREVPFHLFRFHPLCLSHSQMRIRSEFLVKTNHLLHIVDRLTIRRNSRIFPHSSRAGVVCGQRQTKIPV